MSRYHSYLNTAVAVLSSYDGQEPFPFVLKKFFAGEKKYGSRDRKMIAHLCYCFFRTALLFDEGPRDEKILRGLFLCSAQPDEILQQLKPEWNEKIQLSTEEKILLLYPGRSVQDLFPFADELSGEIDVSRFSLSHLIQPNLFLRTRPGYEEIGLKKLAAAEISYEAVDESCIVMPNATKTEHIFEMNKEVVVQDYSSQRVGGFLKMAGSGLAGQRISVWDCCAGSGGKSILAKDVLGDIDLTVSDVRENILVNLKKRFSQAGIENYKSLLLDLSDKGVKHSIINNQQSIVICDAPCTGSGTWSRTPEQLFYFDKKKIAEYAELQRKIVSNTISYLKPGGHLLYITCSVFKKENEETVKYLEEKFHLQLLKMEYLEGYDKKADTMFAALLAKPL